MLKLKKSEKELIAKLKKLEEFSRNLSNELEGIRDEIELPYILEEVKGFLRQKKTQTISTAWLQRKYNIGYARSARLMDLLREKRIIK